jgi:hypothetical protein
MTEWPYGWIDSWRRLNLGIPLLKTWRLIGSLALCMGIVTPLHAQAMQPVPPTPIDVKKVVVGYFHFETGWRHAPLHAPIERIFSQDGKPRSGDGPKLFCLQLHQDSSYTSHIPSDGCWRDGSAVERRGLGSPLGSLRTAEGGKSGMSEGTKKRKWKHWTRFSGTPSPSVVKTRKRREEGLCIGCGKDPCQCKNPRDAQNSK